MKVSLAYQQTMTLKSGHNPGSAKAVILLWLWGGPSQLDTFDPKPHAPLDYRGPFATIPTRLIARGSGEIPL